VKDNIKTRKVSILAANGYDHKNVSQIKKALEAGGAKAHIISKHQGMLKSSSGEELEVDEGFVTTASVLYDAVYIPGGKENMEALKMQEDAIHFVNEAFRHRKPLGATGAVLELLKAANLPDIKYQGGNLLTKRFQIKVL
jgi:catalase